MMTNKFSVLMSVYYKETSQNLKVALDSVINQSMPPNEIILVEDGKLTDDLYDLISIYKKKYQFIKVIPLSENQGLGKALNEGLKHCKYELVARMDSDDCSVKNRFEKQLRVFDEKQDIDIVGSNVTEYDEKLLNVTSKKNVPETDAEIKKYMKRRNPINHMSVMYKKNSVIKAGSYVDCPFFEDYYLWCRMAKDNCLFYNIQDSLVNVRAGIYMIEKRGGKQYNKYILNFQKKLKKIGIINTYQYITNIIIRTIISSCSPKLRMKIYKNNLRKK